MPRSLSCGCSHRAQQTINKIPVKQENNKMASKLAPCPILQRAIPLLKREFAKQSNNFGEFPIFSKRQMTRAWRDFPKRVPNDQGAAILVAVCSFENKPSILFTKRASHLSSHSSEISFPGGHVESDDATLQDAALRETREEIDTPLKDIIVLGEATAVPSIKGVPVTPIIAVLPNELDESMLTGDPSEVDEVFCQSIESLVREETSKHLARLGSPAPVYPSPHGDIWGLTAFVLRPIMHNLLQPVFEELEPGGDEGDRITSL